MRMHSTYSFKDLAGAITHPVFPLGPYQFTGGTGLGGVTVSMTTERTQHEVGADGVVMVSKIEGKNGNIVIECQQTSELHKYLLKLFNYLETAPTGQWAMAVIVMRNLFDGTGHIATGVSFSKIAEKPYKAQGQMVSWTLMAANIDNTTY